METLNAFDFSPAGTLIERRHRGRIYLDRVADCGGGIASMRSVSGKVSNVLSSAGT